VTISGFTYLVNIDYAVGNVGNVDISTMSSSNRGVDCAASCKSLSNCVGFVLKYTSSGMTCTLKSGMKSWTLGVASSIAYMIAPSYSGYVFWAQHDFNGGLSGNADGSSISTGIDNAVASCNSLGTGCMAVSYPNPGTIYLKTKVTTPNTDNLMAGIYVKTISGYVTLPSIDIYPNSNSFTVQKNDLDCTSYCTSFGGCIGLGLYTDSNCYGRSSYNPSASSGMVSFIQVRSVCRYCLFIIIPNQRSFRIL
jgi:PAN domain